MSLFDFIEKELSKEDRIDLFSDKTVCLCLFRVALSPLEQQLLYKFLFLDASTGLTPRDISNALRSDRGASDNVIGARQGDIKLDQAKTFCKKLVNLDLLEEIEEEKKESGANSLS